MLEVILLKAGKAIRIQTTIYPEEELGPTRICYSQCCLKRLKTKGETDKSALYL